MFFLGSSELVVPWGPICHISGFEVQPYLLELLLQLIFSLIQKLNIVMLYLPTDFKDYLD